MYKLAHFFLLINFVVCQEKVETISSTKWSQPYAPFYDPLTNSLYFTELNPHLVHRYDLAENRVYSASIGNLSTAFIIPLQDCEDKFIISNGLTVKLIEWNGSSSKVRVIRDVFSLENVKKYAGTGWDIAKISPLCQFYGGTYRLTICADTTNENAALFQYTKSHEVKRRIKHLKLTGDFEWNTDKNLFYINDCCRKTLVEFKWNPVTGTFYDGRLVHKYEDNGDKALIPVGLTIDTKGFLYATEFFGGVVLKINPTTGEVVKTIKIPAEAVSGITFGGRNFDTLFVTTQAQSFNTTKGGLSDRKLSPLSGSVFKITGLKARGFPRKKFCFNCC